MESANAIYTLIWGENQKRGFKQEVKLLDSLTCDVCVSLDRWKSVNDINKNTDELFFNQQ